MNHADQCWLRASGYAIRVSPITPREVWKRAFPEIARLRIPKELAAGVCMEESSWRHTNNAGVVIHSLKRCEELFHENTGFRPPEIGLMQLSGATAQKFDIQRLISDPTYNFVCGLHVLAEKWDDFYQNICPNVFPGMPRDHDRMIIENWWYPLKIYNSTWEYNDPEVSYVRRVYQKMKEQSPVMAGLVRIVNAVPPDKAILDYKNPWSGVTGKGYFQARRTGDWVAWDGKIVSVPVTVESLAERRNGAVEAIVRAGRIIRARTTQVKQKLGRLRF